MTEQLSFQGDGSDRLPPQNIEAEEAILGGIMLDPEAIGRVSDSLIPEAFYISAHKETSNIELKVFPNMAEHPIKRLMDAGVFVTVNSDDPSMFNADVVDNYVQVAETFNLTAKDIEKLARNSFLAAFMDDVTLSNCLHGFTNTVTQLQTEIFNQ